MPVAVRDLGGTYREVSSAELATADETMRFLAVAGRTWRFEMRAGETGYLVLRGLRFYSGEDELFGPLVPVCP